MTTKEEEKRERITAILDNRVSVTYYDDPLHRLLMIEALLTYTWNLPKIFKYIDLFLFEIDNHVQEFPITEKLYRVLSELTKLVLTTSIFFPRREDLLVLLIDIGCSADSAVIMSSPDPSLIRKGYRFPIDPPMMSFDDKQILKLYQNYLHGYIITL